MSQFILDLAAANSLTPEIFVVLTTEILTSSYLTSDTSALTSAFCSFYLLLSL